MSDSWGQNYDFRVLPTKRAVDFALGRMKPYYDDGQAVIYHGDCREVLPSLVADVTVTDPPYSTQTHEGARTDDGDHVLVDFPALTDEDVLGYFTQIGKSTRRWVVATVDWKHVSLLERQTPTGLRFVRFGVWVKPNAMPQMTGDRPSMGWEALALLHTAGGRMRWNGGGRHAVFTENKVNTEHPTGKPLGLVRELVQLFSDEGETVLDPFMGSGTTLRAAKDLGRRSIGIELEERYCEIAATRLAQQTLFGAA